MAARGHKFYLRVLKVSLTSERSERVRDVLSSREDKIRIPKQPCNVPFIIEILMKFPHKRQLFLRIFETAKKWSSILQNVMKLQHKVIKEKRENNTFSV